MSSQGNIPTLARAIQLFGYEAGSGADSRLWANPMMVGLVKTEIAQI